MNPQELIHLLALLQVEGVGDIVAKKLLHHCGSAQEIFASKKGVLQKIDGIGEVLIKKLQNKEVFTKAELEMRYLEKYPHAIYYFKDNNYPDKLKHCLDGPVLLFGRGNIQWKQRKIISLVGTRNITNYGTDFLKSFIETIQPFDPIIVSGFAYGVDITAHKLAMENKLQTIGVLAHGLNQFYPKVHEKYAKKMEENGGFLTEFWSSSQPDKENFVKRNRIIAGISEATIVIESAEKGGSIITANLANDYNRDVFAVPGRVKDKYSQGCNQLIKTQKAQMITCAEDLIYLLDWKLDEKPTPTIQKQLFVQLSEKEQTVYDYLLNNGKQLLDEISLHCSIPIHQLSSMLLQMELQGVIRPLPGKWFEAI